MFVFVVPHAVGAALIEVVQRLTTESWVAEAALAA